jgi:hypothetical protein
MLQDLTDSESNSTITVLQEVRSPLFPHHTAFLAVRDSVT